MSKEHNEKVKLWLKKEAVRFDFSDKGPFPNFFTDDDIKEVRAMAKGKKPIDASKLKPKGKN